MKKKRKKCFPLFCFKVKLITCIFLFGQAFQNLEPLLQLADRTVWRGNTSRAHGFLQWINAAYL